MHGVTQKAFLCHPVSYGFIRTHKEGERVGSLVPLGHHHWQSVGYLPDSGTALPLQAFVTLVLDSYVFPFLWARERTPA